MTCGAWCTVTVDWTHGGKSADALVAVDPIATSDVATTIKRVDAPAPSTRKAR